MFYVLGTYSDPWVLDKYPTLIKARAAIRWQNGLEGDYVVATRTGPDTFALYADPTVTFTVQRGPYTEEAFEAFKAEWSADQ